MSRAAGVEPIRIFVVDDHPLFRDSIRSLVSSADDLELVGEATNGQEAIIDAVDLQPDVILMDIKIPDMDGIQATREIVRTSAHIRVLILTMLEDDNSVFSAMRAGAQGYLLKGAGYEETLRSIRAAACGQAIFSSSIARRTTDFFNAMDPANPQGIFPELTAREREIPGLMSQAYNNQPENGSQSCLEYIE